MPPSPDTQWTDEELRAAVAAYLQMLADEQRGTRPVKANYRRDLIKGPLQARSEPSVEYRMRNISVAMADMGLPCITGYLPVANVGAGVNTRLARIVAEALGSEAEHFARTADPDALARRANAIRRHLPAGVPPGVVHPRKMDAVTSRFERDPVVRAYVLEAAVGVCELCSRPAPFLDAEGHPFLELHHVRTLAEGGSDTVHNAVALCPNCHRHCHYAAEREHTRRLLYAQVARLAFE